MGIQSGLEDTSKGPRVKSINPLADYIRYQHFSSLHPFSLPSSRDNMSEASHLMGEEDFSAWGSSDDDSEAESHSVDQSSSDESVSHHRGPPLLSSQFRVANFSTASIQSNLFTHSWRRPGSYSISSLCSYITSTPATPITLLKWCKDRKGVKHQFLVLKVERPGNSKLWLRLERRAHKNAKGVKLLSSPAPSGDTVELSNDLSHLFDASESKIQVETTFTVPPLLQKLGDLLSILIEDSPDYKLYSENCYFFCAIIYEILVSLGKGMDVAGAPNQFSMSLALGVKARIKERMGISPPDPSPINSSLGLSNPLLTVTPSISPPIHVQQVADEGSVAQPLDVRLDPLDVREDFSPRRMYVGVDFGTVSSGVACGVSPGTVEQILWPGSNRKVPTCLVYDAQGRVAAWGYGAQTVKLEKGWIRCEMFELCLDPTSGSGGIPDMLPSGKKPIDVITDYLRKLWESAKPKIIERGYTQDTLESADIWISIPAAWKVRSDEIMRNAAYAAGLVAPRGLEQMAGARSRVHIISEIEAVAVHCALWRDLHFQPGQSFIVCRAGGDTIDTAIYKVRGNSAQIEEHCASSGANCGSHFLDIYFLIYLEEWHRTRNIPLSERNLAHYMHAFAYSQKLAFTGRQDAIDFHFECYDVSDYTHADLSDDEFFNGQLVVPAKVLRRRVFDPVVNNILDLLEAQLRRVDSVDALFLVGGFFKSQYLFGSIWNAFHVRLEGRIQTPKDPDIAASIGAAQSGLAQSLAQRPIGPQAMTASNNHAIGIETVQAAESEDTRDSRSTVTMLGLNQVSKELMRPDLAPGQGRICVGIDFGTVLSGVAFGTSPGTVEQILWPGPYRKVPTCLVYDAKGRVVAWGRSAQAVKLEKGWIRCKMFNLDFDPTGVSNDVSKILPPGKEPVDVITDYLRKLWENAKPKIMERGYTQSMLNSADIWISIPAAWNVRRGELMRDAAYAAGLVAPWGSEQYASGQSRLHIISEMEAAAVHCALWRDLHFHPGQSLMVCRAGGNSIDIAIYTVLGNVTQIAERFTSSEANCGSHFLDICFRNYLEEWHRARHIPLSEMNLEHYMHAFTYSQKLAFTGRQDTVDFRFECFDASDYAHSDLSDDEFFNGQLVVPAKDLRERVFDPVVHNVLDVLAAQFRKVNSVDALLLVGGFSANHYLFDSIWNAFHVRLKDRIQTPKDPDIAASLGAAQSGLAQRLIQRPIGPQAVIASKSYVIGIETNGATKPKGTGNSRKTAAMLSTNEVFKAQYVVVKGALLQKGVPVLETFTKTFYGPSDCLFTARLYSSDSAKMHPDTSGDDLEHILDWKIDLTGVPSFKDARNPPKDGFDAVFELGFEIDSWEAYAIWSCEGKECARLRLPDVLGN